MQLGVAMHNDAAAAWLLVCLSLHLIVVDCVSGCGCDCSCGADRRRRRRRQFERQAAGGVVLLVGQTCCNGVVEQVVGRRCSFFELRLIELRSARSNCVLKMLMLLLLLRRMQMVMLLLLVGLRSGLIMQLVLD